MARTHSMAREHILWQENTFYGKRTHSIECERRLVCHSLALCLCVCVCMYVGVPGAYTAVAAKGPIPPHSAPAAAAAARPGDVYAHMCVVCARVVRAGLALRPKDRRRQKRTHREFAHTHTHTHTHKQEHRQPQAGYQWQRDRPCPPRWPASPGQHPWRPRLARLPRLRLASPRLLLRLELVSFIYVWCVCVCACVCVCVCVHMIGAWS